MGFAKSGNIVAGAAHRGKTIAGAYSNGRLVFETLKKQVFSLQVEYRPDGFDIAYARRAQGEIAPTFFRGFEIRAVQCIVFARGSPILFGVYFEDIGVDLPASLIQKIEIKKAGFVQTFELGVNLNKATGSDGLWINNSDDNTGGFTEGGAWEMSIYYDPKV